MSQTVEAGEPGLLSQGDRHARRPDFPPSQVTRFTDRLHRLPAEQRHHVIKRAGERAQGERHCLRDKVITLIGVADKFRAAVEQ